MSNFPSSIDTLDDKEDGVDYPQAADINGLNDAVEKLEAKVGIDGSAVSTSLDYKLKNTTSGHDHDGTDSKKVLATNLDVTGVSASAYLRVNAGGSAVEGSSLTIPSGDLVGTTSTQTLSAKTLTSPIINTQITGTAIVDEDTMVSNSALKVPTQQSVKAYVDAAVSGATGAWPIGSVFTSVVSTNPATLLGFGTWSAIAAGKMLIGLDSTDATMDTVMETGGAKTANLAHTHAETAHTHAYSGTTGVPSASDIVCENENNGSRGASNHTHAYSGTSSANGATSTGSAGSATQSIMNPFFVVYFWRRTA